MRKSNVQKSAELVQKLNSIDDENEKYVKIQKCVYEFMENKHNKATEGLFMISLSMSGLDNLNTLINMCKKSDIMKKFIRKHLKYYVLINHEKIRGKNKLFKKLLKLVSKNKLHYTYNVIRCSLYLSVLQ